VNWLDAGYLLQSLPAAAVQEVTDDEIYTNEKKGKYLENVKTRVQILQRTSLTMRRKINHVDSHISYDKNCFHASNRRSLLSEFVLIAPI
jgi:hypothetical protein